MAEAPPLTANDAERASWCDCAIQREMRQGTGKQGKVWRGEFCVLNECEVLWWRFNSQIGLWISPIYDPYEYVYPGLKGSPWEHLDPQPKEEDDGKPSDVELFNTEGNTLRSEI